ncbi:hypothetical protein [Nocardioides sp. GXZ039]|uniref:hypothetical protein n=1 Tax=Nocardioides sp. GXZ039 TaxID=3136018 RepID=UPI0030F42260
MNRQPRGRAALAARDQRLCLVCGVLLVMGGLLLSLDDVPPLVVCVVGVALIVALRMSAPPGRGTPDVPVDRDGGRVQAGPGSARRMAA